MVETMGLEKIEVLCDPLMIIIEEEVSNIKMYRNICQEFSKKNLNQLTVQSIFSKKKDLIDCKNVELMTLTDAITKELIAEGLVEKYNIRPDISDILKELKMSTYFTESDIEMWKVYKSETPVSNQFEVKYCEQISKFRYTGSVTYKQIYESRINNVLIDNKDSQRKSNMRMLGSRGNYVRELVTNEKNVDKMAEKILKGTFDPTEILLNCLLIDKKTPQIRFDPIIENAPIGNLKITINPDKNSPTETELDLIDGRHRVKAICKAYAEHLKITNGEELEGKITLQVFVVSLTKAKRIVESVFLRSEDDVEWQKSLSVSAYSEFADAIISKSKVLKGTPDILDHCRVQKSYTYKNILTSMVRALKIDVNSPAVQEFDSEYIAKFLDMLIDVMKRSNIEIDYTDKPNLFAGYVSLAWNLQGFKMDSDTWEYLELLLSDRVNPDMVKRLRLNHKTFVISAIQKEFEQIANEVKRNAR